MNQLKKRSWRGLWPLANWASVLIIVAVTFGAGYALRWGCAPHAPEQAAAPAGAAATAPARADQPIWYCSMHPHIRQPKPGRCPICGMELELLGKQGRQASLRGISFSESAKSLMDVETAPVERRFVTATLRMVGKIDYDETRLAYITAWVPGRIDRLFVDYTGVNVKKGDHMVELYSPELIDTQKALLEELRGAEALRQTNVALVRERLRLWGLTPEQIQQIEKTGKVVDRTTIFAPRGGIVIRKHVQQGEYVKTGERIYTIADLSQVWVKLDAYESDLAWIRPGQGVEFTTVAYPGETFSGWISFIDPILNQATRTVKVRVTAANPQGKLKPEMFVKAVVRAEVAAAGKVMDKALAGKWMCRHHPDVVKDAAGECDRCGWPLETTESLGYASADPARAEKPLVIPASAVLKTGTRAVVYVAVDGAEKPTYEGREILLGPRAGEYYLVRAGLEEGQRVVTRGNFKIDSALQIQAKPSMMMPDGGAAPGGHEHGGPGPAKPAETPEMARPAELPAPFKQRLHAVTAAAAGAKKAIAAEDLPEARAAFAAVEKAVSDADAEAAELKGHPRMMWAELSMRLKNDGVEGKQAKTLEEAQRVAESLAKNIALLADSLGLGREHAPAPGQKPAANKEEPGHEHHQ